MAQYLLSRSDHGEPRPSKLFWFEHHHPHQRNDFELFEKFNQKEELMSFMIANGVVLSKLRMATMTTIYNNHRHPKQSTRQIKHLISVFIFRRRRHGTVGDTNSLWKLRFFAILDSSVRQQTQLLESSYQWLASNVLVLNSPGEETNHCVLSFAVSTMAASVEPML